MAEMKATDLAGCTLAGWALREANMRFALAADGPVHVQLGEAPYVHVLNDGIEVLYHREIPQLRVPRTQDTVPGS